MTSHRSTFVALAILTVNAFGVERQIVYQAPYGAGNGEYHRTHRTTNWEEMYYVPGEMYVFHNKLVVNDKYGARWQVTDLNSGEEVRTIVKPPPISFIDLEDSVCLYKSSVYRITAGDTVVKWYVFQNEKPGRYRDIDYVLCHSSQYKIVMAGKSYCLDPNYQVVDRDELPKEIQFVAINHHSAWFFEDKQAFLGAPVRNLKYLIELKYHELAGTDTSGDVPEIYPYPDSAEAGNYFTKGFSRTWANHDSECNSYFYSNDCDSFRVHDSTFSVVLRQTGDPKNPIERKVAGYKEEMAIVSSYDRLGQLRFWFPEPPLEEGWKKAACPIFVSREGRIFRMIFYSHANKPEHQIDPTKGIRILEYIPEKHDFTHGGRVKHYGTGK